ncbi:neutral amino acid transporter [Tulasnella sp. 330]|nr:neutral amino acid transporter [Tulasnella sp. 330]KAG8884724.1 neutral amino acid transporter [Tulasnella sp. 331]
MSKEPARPLPISSPRSGHRVDDAIASIRDEIQVSASPRPDLDRLRERINATPPPNIPQRPFAPPTSSSPFRQGQGGSLGASPAVGTPRSFAPSARSSRPSTPRPGAGGFPRTDTLDPQEGRRSGSRTPVVQDMDDLSPEEKARVLRRHLVSREERARQEDEGDNMLGVEMSPNRTPTGTPGRRPSVAGPGSIHRMDTEPFPIPFSAPGGDITHDIYKWQSDTRRNAAAKRSRSVSGPIRANPVDPAFEHIHEPGGLRRNYVLLKAREQGVEQPQIISNFVDFLYLFGHFAGEDLEEEEEDDIEDIDDETLRAWGAEPSSSGIRQRVDTSVRKDDAGRGLETEPLLGSPIQSRLSSKISKANRKRRSSVSVGPHGNATVPQAVLMLLKSFIGTGVLFLGKAFFNGGMLFSSVILVSIAMISLYSFLLLVRSKFVVPGSFGDIGGILYGTWMRRAILFSIVVSQLGFVAAYLIFVAQNLQAFVLAVTNCEKNLPIIYLILAQMVVFMPLSLIRNLAKLSTTALVADAFILVGLLYIGGNEVAQIASHGIAEVQLFNKKDFPLLIGTAVFSFEGIGLVIPISDAMRQPQKFPKVLTGVMIFLTVLFGGAGALSYAAYGADIQTVVIVNLPQDQKFVQVVQFLYSIAILLSAPLQLFPALRIMENALWGTHLSGKMDLKVKWQKNAFRVLIVFGCTMISWAGAKDLDKFVSFVGSFCCIPLCFVYPAMLHLRAVSKTRRQRWADYAMIFFGLAATVYTSIGTIQLMMEPPTGNGPQFGKCRPSPEN